MSTERTDVESSVPLFRISVERYHAMRDAGIVGEDDRVELLAGLLVPKMTKKPPHRLATGLARQAIEPTLPRPYYLDSQEPITLEDSEPEPDLVVVRGARRDYSDRHPGAPDVAMVVEIADESLDRNRGIKLSLYARAGIAVYWIVDLQDRVVEVHTDPDGDSYRSRVAFTVGDEAPLVIDGHEVARIAVRALLP
ncbi:MAG: Uma2 family endonuclease [Deltaproteobacteria bacterium]|nr:Uma2 family endonuclease [Deltaproteobacteria bacterium]